VTPLHAQCCQAGRTEHSELQTGAVMFEMQGFT
jgi:hypothetical protein